MKLITFSHEKTSLISGDTLTRHLTDLKPEIDRLKAARSASYDTPYASINLPGDAAGHNKIKKAAQSLHSSQPTMLIIVGIGGSNLGTLAIHRALHGALYNELHPDMQIYFADTVDTDTIYDLQQLILHKIKNNYRIILNVISKSGTTTETIANFQILFHLLHAQDTSGNHTVIVTTDEGSKLWHIGENQKFTCLPIPAKVGGRFSVFSAVGLLPLSLLGVNTDHLLAGAQSAVEMCTSNDTTTNIAALRAATIHAHARNGITIHNMFVFSPDLEGIGLWYRQLMGESIGKEKNTEGKTIHAGITPLISIGSTDLHSVGQLYLGGPNNMLTTFVGIAQQKNNVTVPINNAFSELVTHIQGKSLSSIMSAIMVGTQRAYAKGARPFTTLVVPEKSAWHLGYLMQMQMIEIMYLGYLMQVNPFDQPEVERYKHETREILAHE